MFLSIAVLKVSVATFSTMVNSFMSCSSTGALAFTQRTMHTRPELYSTGHRPTASFSELSCSPHYQENWARSGSVITIQQRPFLTPGKWRWLRSRLPLISLMHGVAAWFWVDVGCVYLADLLLLHSKCSCSVFSFFSSSSCPVNGWRLATLFW